MGSVALIPIWRGKRVVAYAIIDAEDLLKATSVTKFRMRGKPGRQKPAGYVRGSGAANRQDIDLHRLVMGDPPGVLFDHIDRDVLNCRKSNLRPATVAQNCWNQGPRKGTSAFKGVNRQETKTYGTRWEARIRANGEQLSLGKFALEEDAARAYDEAARRLHGEFAYQNFPLTVEDQEAA